MLNSNNSVAIACASGGFKTIFVNGILSAFQPGNIYRDLFQIEVIPDQYQQVPIWLG